MKIQILISKNSWAQTYKKIIIRKFKKFTKNPLLFSNHIKLKRDFDVNIIFSYFKKIPNKYLKKSKFNLIPHESNLPKGKGMSPLTWQILEGRRNIIFSLIEADKKIDSGKIYYKKKVNIPKTFLFDEIKKTQLYNNLNLIEKFLKYYKKNKKPPRGFVSNFKETFYKRREPNDSKVDINKKIKNQFNLLRVVDNKKYPAYFKIHGKKYLIKIEKA